MFSHSSRWEETLIRRGHPDPTLASPSDPISQGKEDQAKATTCSLVEPVLADANPRAHAAGNLAATVGRRSDDNRLLTVPELAIRLRVNCAWVYVHADHLGAYRLGKYLRFAWERVLERLER
jgi:hypothetical protein